jgi:subfamily B ATP-binding cassette protein MsbA
MTAPFNTRNQLLEPTSKSVVKIVFPFVWAQRKWIAFSFLFALGVAGIQIQTSVLVKDFMDIGILAKDPTRTWQLCGLLVVWFFLEGIFDFFHKFAIRIGAERLVRSLRNQIFERYLIFSRPLALRFSSAKAATNISVDISTVSWAIIHCTNLIREPLVIIGLFSYLFYLNWQLTLVCLFAIPAIGVVGFYLGKSARRNQRKIQKGQENVMNITLEAIQGLENSQIMGQPHKILSNFKNKTQEVYTFFLRLARAEELGSPLSKWVGSIFGASLIGLGGFMVAKGLMTAGELTAYIVTAGRIQAPLKMLNEINVKFNQAAAAAERLSQTLEEPLDDVSRSHQKMLLQPAQELEAKDFEKLKPQEIRISNLSFEYHGASPAESTRAALKNIQVTISPRSKVALVGKSGAGKSTLTRLILRLMDPMTGSITFGGQDIRQLDLDFYRKNFAFVAQETFLFSESIRANFEFIRKPRNDDEIWEALKLAHADEFVRRMPKGLDEGLGDRSQHLSGGEKQRLSIARAFFKKAPIVILDEPTSQLDSINEKLISESLEKLFQDRTAIVIAHRISTVRNCDHVIVLEDGKVLENGRTQDLLDRKSERLMELWNS